MRAAEPGTRPAEGTVVVTAEALDGYVLADGERLPDTGVNTALPASVALGLLVLAAGAFVLRRGLG